MSDLVERLRAAQDDPDLIYGDVDSFNLCAEAADRLTALEAEVARLRLAVREARGWIEAGCPGGDMGRIHGNLGAALSAPADGQGGER